MPQAFTSQPGYIGGVACEPLVLSYFQDEQRKAPDHEVLSGPDGDQSGDRNDCQERMWKELGGAGYCVPFPKDPLWNSTLPDRLIQSVLQKVLPRPLHPSRHQLCFLRQDFGQTDGNVGEGRNQKEARKES